ncbi:hypothetical protein KKH27_01520 [bacterium]|nr:hypothetical protein [bacterium]
MNQNYVPSLGGQGSTEQETLADLVSEFQATPQRCCDDDEYYAGLTTLEEVIQKAALALTATGSVSSHQRQWVRPESMQQAVPILLAAIESIRACKDFDSLLLLTTRKLAGIDGLGDLYYYDTSRRIGAFLGLFPLRVYLHRGTKEGAKALGLDHTRPYINMVSVPPELRCLEPKHVEDFLCRYKDRLKKIR